MLLIADDDGPTSIAGIMGGQRSEVQPNTTRVLMEAANWNGPNLQRTSYRLGLRTEASGRFEKGLAPELDDGRPGARGAADARADRRDAAARHGRRRRAGPGAEDAARCATRRSRACSAPQVPLGEQRDILERLEFGVADDGDGFDVTVPHFRRNDVTREVDLIEEVARLWGLEKLPATIPGHGMSGAPDGRAEAAPPRRRRARRRRVLRGDRLELPVARDRRASCGSTAPAVRLRNPLSEDLSDMRTTPARLAARRPSATTPRAARDDVRLFEEGTVYFDRPHGNEPTAAEQRSTPLPDEQMHLAALMTGRVAAGVVAATRRRRRPTSSPPRACWRRC